MFDGDRGKRPALVAIALGFSVAALIFVSYAWMFYDMGGSRAQYAADSERNAQHNAAYTAQRIENECVDAGGPALRDCIAEAVEAGAEYQQSERDLEAQRGMSKWAFWLLIVASGQLAATVIALIYLKSTLDATWRAVNETGDATKAMVRQNKLAEAAQRPLLKLAVQFSDIAKLRDGQVKVETKVAVVNRGESTAMNVFVRVFARNWLDAPDDDIQEIRRQFAAQEISPQTAILRGDELDCPYPGWLSADWQVPDLMRAVVCVFYTSVHDPKTLLETVNHFCLYTEAHAGGQVPGGEIVARVVRADRMQEYDTIK